MFLNSGTLGGDLDLHGKRAKYLILKQLNTKNQIGFISIDCGLPEGTNYTDDGTGIFYTSDAGFIDTGENKEIQSTLISSTLAAQYRNLRSFPEGDRNCYTVRPVVKGNRYLVRASFMHGNYDGTVLPVFNLFLGVNLWTEVTQKNSSKPGWTEIITIATANYLSVCLEKKQGTPFISVLEVRALAFAMYNASDETQALVLYNRFDVGSSSSKILRYKDDVYDRIWSPFHSDVYASLNTSSLVANDISMFQPPPAVLGTAVAPANSNSTTLYFNWTADNPQEQYHVYRHIAEVEVLKAGEFREFNVCVTGFDTCYGPYSPTYLVATTLYTITPFSGRLEYSCHFVRTAASTLPPIFNAIEIYTLAKLSVVPTNDGDVNSIMGVKNQYRVKRNWMGDPCVPQDYTWEGVTCSYDDPTSPRIVSLNLSSSGLSGIVVHPIGNLSSLQSLDLSANNLTGEIPDFLATLPSLTFLNLSANNFTGSVPSTLLQRSKSGTLQLSVDNNLIVNQSDPCTTSSCKKKKKSVAVPVAVSLSAVALILLVSGFIFWKKYGRRKAGASDTVVKTSDGDGSFNLDNRRFTYTEIKSLTSDFQRVLGKGGFGTVYYGRMSDGTQVAVKLLSQNRQGSSEFQTEALLLTRVYHRNLVHLIGYCAEGDKTALILEYMQQGNLSKLLLDKNRTPLSWGQRLRIALDVAQGLEYLHNGCKPPIIHRDVKGTNILLNERLEAKIADFGLSKVFSNDDFSHVSTAVKGTLGYLDPEYCVSNNLNEKSDVYSFGIVMLELITGQSAIVHNSDSQRISIVDWVNPLVSKGDIRAVVDPRLRGEFDINSAWKAVEIAIACVAPKAIQRPAISIAVSELKECLGGERVPQRSHSLLSEDPDTSTSGNSLFRPIAR
ncbi:probable LRR receptor-like serine/threonine-protein kinase At1g05700 [Aristolochia californica]|uniref:probable LRR receptor-like serine/threonine-protein kinase At1g05700 n=1 Tax=Aristolochia californica TaxID=171875 RepID=UPI0035D92871